MTEPFEPPTPAAPAGPDDMAEARSDPFPSWAPPGPPAAHPGPSWAPPDPPAANPGPSWSAPVSDPGPAWAAPTGAVGAAAAAGPGGPGNGAATAPPAAGGPWGDPRPWSGPTQPGWPAAGSPGGSWSAPGGGAGGGQTGGGGYGPGGWTPGGWTPPPGPNWGGTWDAEPPRKKGRVGSVAAITAAMLVAAFVGVGIGRAVNQNRTIAATSTPVQQVPAIPGFPGLGSGSGSGSGSSGSGSGSGSGASGSNSATVANVEAGVVDINTSLGYQSASAAGTGMVITSSGEVLTNNHVIDGATRITATLVTTGKTYTAKVVGTDVTGDVALLQLEGASGLKTVPLGDSSTVSSGASVIAIGNAGGVGGAPSVVDGTVQATGQTITASDQGGTNAERLSNLIETNAPIQPGDSGGPLVDANGKVIGMDTAASSGNRFQASADVAFAIPINDAMSIIHQIESGQESSTIHLGLPGFLGVAVQDSSSLLGGSSGSSGATVSSVVSGSPAANAGIHAGDTITAVNGQSIGSSTDLTTQLRSHHPGDSVTVSWTDSSGSQHTATVKLITGPAS